jgi:hypothetical protein
LQHFTDGIEKNHEMPENSWSSGRDLKQNPPEYNAGVLNIWPQYFVVTSTDLQILPVKAEK